MYQPLITFCPHPAIFTQVLCIFDVIIDNVLNFAKWVTSVVKTFKAGVSFEVLVFFYTWSLSNSDWGSVVGRCSIRAVTKKIRVVCYSDFLVHNVLPLHLLSWKDSNPHWQSQNLECYHYTTGQGVITECKFATFFAYLLWIGGDIMQILTYFCISAIFRHSIKAITAKLTAIMLYCRLVSATVRRGMCGALSPPTRWELRREVPRRCCCRSHAWAVLCRTCPQPVVWWVCV